MKKTICFYVVATDLGGAERSLIEIVKALQADSSGEWRPWVLLPKKEGPLLEELNKVGVQYSTVEFPSVFLKLSRKNKASILKLLGAIPSLLIYSFKLNREVKKIKPKLIHTTGVKCHFLAPVFGAISGIPVMWHIRDIFPAGFTLKLFKAYLKIFKIKVIANSKASAVPFEGSTEVEVVYNGINPKEFFPLRNDRYQLLFSNSGQFQIVGIVGAFARWKGQIEFLKAARILVDRNAPVRFVVVGGEIYDTSGESNLTQELHDEVKRLDLSEMVKFTGFEKNSPQVMNGIDILVHASIQPEPFGRVIIEGMACGASLVVSKWGAAPEFFTDHVNGLMVDPREPVEIANAVEWLVQHAEQRFFMIQKSRELFLERFTHESYIRAMEAQFKMIARD